MGKAFDDVLAERQRQIVAEGFTPARDDQYLAGELEKAAACFALESTGYAKAALLETLWPKSWSRTWFKPASKRRLLVKAAALLIAAIERLDRKGGTA